jgi:hypothetical protein
MSLRSFQRRGALPAASAFLVVAALCAAPVIADNHELPGADEIIARHVEALGGEAAIRAHASVTTNGSFEMPAMGMSAAMTIFQIAPDQGIVRISMPGMGESVQAYNGEIAWVEDPMQGNRLLEGGELNAMKRQFDLHADLRYDEHYPQRATAGEAEWNGQAAYQVDLVDADGTESSRYFSVETGLLLGEEASITNEMGTMETTTTWSDYKEFGGVMFATSATTNLVSMGMEFIQTVESMTFDDVDPSVLEPSDAIKGLLPE